MKTSRLALLLVSGFAFGGIGYLAVRHYDHTVALREYCFDLPDPCRPNRLTVAATSGQPTDEVIQQNIAGTWWHCVYPHYLDDKLIWRLSRVVAASNGDYVCHVTFGNGVIHSNAIQGHWRVKDGLLFDTITNYCFNFTNQPVLHLFSNQVVRVTDRELLYRRCSDGNLELFRRVKRVDR